jgi:hypothetical protein
MYRGSTHRSSTHRSSTHRNKTKNKYRKHKNTKRTYRNKNKCTKRKQLGGGEVIMSLEQIIDSINTSHAEICGYINGNKQFIKTNDGPEIKLDAQGKRISAGSCQMKQNYPKLWHTHPAISKYYPSFEDIVKVLKHQINISTIYTKYGYWVLKCPTQYEYFPDAPYAFIPTVNKLLDNFYKQTNNGKDYNSVAIQFLTTHITTVIQNSFAKDFTLEWNTY